MSFLTALIVAIIVFGIVILGMAIGAMVARKPIQGTCGGLGQMQDRFGEPLCDICEGEEERKPSDCSMPDHVKERCLTEGPQCH
jgi:hypothetical protein